MGSKANILVVDDELGPRESLKMILKPLSHVHTAENGDKALELIKGTHINLVTLDLKMPGIPGIEVLKEIKRLNNDIEVVVLTGYGTLSTAVEALRYGALDYITKPFDVPQVKKVIKKGIERYNHNMLNRQLAQRLEISGKAFEEVVKNGPEELEDQLVYTEKLTILGQLAPKIAHEINNPLQIIYGRAQQGLLKSKGETLLNKYFDNIFAEAEKIDRIARQIMDFGRPSAKTIEKTDVQDVLENSLCLLQDFGEIKRCEVIRDYGESLPLIRIDKHQLEQVFINLIINASHAIEEVEEKRLTVKTKLSADGKFIEVNITDTGVGIEEENIEKIFTPFFTTKAGVKGNGLGLSVVKTIISKHKGHIEVKSKVGKGTSFKVCLPLNSSDTTSERVH